MCGRFTLTRPGGLKNAFPSITFPAFTETRLPRYNIAPTQGVLGVRNDGRQIAEALRWGIRGRINIRAESLCARRSPLVRRCVEFADGFYEWHDRRPFYYTLKSGEPFALAGLWEPDNGAVACDVITCVPNAVVAPVHNRMPVMLTSGQAELWLDPQPLPPEIATSILRPFEPSLMEVREISSIVNNANYDAADVLADPAPRLL